MSCPNCNQTLLNGVYYCDTSDYRVIDTIEDKNLIFIFKTHDIPSDDVEITDNTTIQYCNANDCNYIMDDYQLEKIIESMNNQSEDEKKLNIIKMYLQRLCINTNQMLSITKVFQSKDIRSDFFIYSKNYITDLENYKKVKIK